MRNDWLPKVDAYEPTLERAAAHAARFVENVAVEWDRPYWLTLSGVTGCGKTLLAEQTYAEAKRFNPADRVSVWQTGTGIYRESDRRPCAFWMTATEFADRCRRDFEYPAYLGRDFLVGIDDVGAARDQTAFVAEALYRLCNARLGKWTIFTTNFSLAEVGKNVDERVASRMIRDGNVFHRIAAGDYAMRAKR